MVVQAPDPVLRLPRDVEVSRSATKGPESKEYLTRLHMIERLPLTCVTSFDTVESRG